MIIRQSSLNAATARLWNPNLKYHLITLALLSRNMPLRNLVPTSLIAVRLLLGIHLLRSIVRRVR